MVDVVVEVARDVRVVREVGIRLRHREVRVLHALARGVDVQRAVGRRHPVAVAQHPVAADAVGLLVEPSTSKPCPPRALTAAIPDEPAPITQVLGGASARRARYPKVTPVSLFPELTTQTPHITKPIHAHEAHHRDENPLPPPPTSTYPLPPLPDENHRPLHTATHPTLPTRSNPETEKIPTDHHLPPTPHHHPKRHPTRPDHPPKPTTTPPHHPTPRQPPNPPTRQKPPPTRNDPPRPPLTHRDPAQMRPLRNPRDPNENPHAILHPRTPNATTRTETLDSQTSPAARRGTEADGRQADERRGSASRPAA